MLFSSCKAQKNLNCFFAIIMGLNTAAISRLSQTWEVQMLFFSPQCDTQTHIIILKKYFKFHRKFLGNSKSSFLSWRPSQ